MVHCGAWSVNAPSEPAWSACGLLFTIEISNGGLCRYQWDVQATVLRVAASMRSRGFRAWMDTEMMSGSTLDSMAAAVENAHCILVCITERYKARLRRLASRQDSFLLCVPVDCMATCLEACSGHVTPRALSVQNPSTAAAATGTALPLSPAHLLQ